MNLIDALKISQAAASAALDQGESPNQSDDEDNSALEIAIQKGWEPLAVKIVKMSVKTGKSCVNASDAEGREMLLLALDAGMDKLGETLVDFGAKKSVYLDQNSALSIAIGKKLRASALAMIAKSKANPQSSCLEDSDQNDMEPLLLALEKGEEEIALALIEAGCNLSCHVDQCSAFPYAVAHASERVVMAMAKRSIGNPKASCINDTDADDNEGLLIAIEMKKDDIAIALIKAGADLSCAKDQCQALPLAVALGRESVALEMISRSAAHPRTSCLNDTDEDDNESLLIAIDRGCDAIAKALVAAGANMSCQKDECQALPLAVALGRDEVALAMIERSMSNPRATCLEDTDEDGNEALLIAIEKGNDKIALALIEAGAQLSCQKDECSALPLAVALGRNDVAKAMIQRSITKPRDGCLDDTDENGNEALLVAIEQGADSVALALIKAGAHLSCQKDACHALPLAIALGRESVALAMVARSVKNPRAPCLNDLDEHGVAALLGAMSHGSIKVAMALIAAGCDLKRSVDQRSAITVAIDDGLDEVALAMIRRSVSNPRSSCIDESDDQGKQALLLAIEKGRDEVALGLIEGGAALDCAWEGCSALAWAIIHKQQKVAVAMIKAMARKNISWMEQTDTEGTDPATLAIRAGQVMTLQALVAHGLDPENTTVGEQSVADFLEKADQSQSVSMDQEARPSRLGLQEMAELARKKLREATALAQSAKERDVKAKVSERSKGESKGPRSSFGL